MGKLKLDTVTLVMVETREHALALKALEECVSKVDFGDVLILTDRPLEFSPLTLLGVKPRIHTVEDWPNKLGWSRSWWYDVPPLLRTAHTLNIQWDSWIWKPELWTDEFLDYDYIGAPWWYKDGMNVGNGGFSLVSTRLKRFLRARRQDFPCNTHVDDDLLCRKYRARLEIEGFRWAPESLAHRFAFECARPSEDSEHFGMHGCFNFGEVLSEEAFSERVRLMLASPYISNPDGYMWKAFSEKYPGVLRELSTTPIPLQRKGA